MRRLCFGGVTLSSGIANFALFILRVFLGLAMIYIGISKIPPSPELVGMVSKIGFPIPYFFAIVAGILEMAGGALLVLGLFTRWGALSIMIVVLTALIFVHAGDPFPVRFLPLLVLFTCFQFLLIGAGNISIDAKMRKKTQEETPHE